MKCAREYATFRLRRHYAVARKASKLQAQIKEIQESLQCPCPSKYRLTYSVDGAEVPGEIVRDGERLAILWKRHAEKKTFTAEEDLEEAIRMARYESFLVSPERAAGKRVTELRQKKRAMAACVLGATAGFSEDTPPPRLRGTLDQVGREHPQRARGGQRIITRALKRCLTSTRQRRRHG